VRRSVLTPVLATGTTPVPTTGHVVLDSAIWDDAEALSAYVRLALSLGIVEPLESAIWRLIEIDPYPERSQLLLALRLAQQGRHQEGLRLMEDTTSRMVRAMQTVVKPTERRSLFPVWLMSDWRGSWASLLEDDRPSLRPWSFMELKGTFPTREQALHAM